MAKRSRTKKASNKGLSSDNRREITGIILLAAAALLLIAFTGAGGALADGLVNTFKLVVGVTTYVLPVLLIFVAIRLFQTRDEPTGGVRWLGLTLLLICVPALIHLSVNESNSLMSAQDGGGGGLVGYLVSRAILSLLSKPSASVLLVAGTLISLVITLNLSFSELFQKLVDWFKNRPAKTDLADQIAEQSAQTPTINAKVPLITGKSAPAETTPPEPEVLTTPSDPNWTLPSVDLLEDKQGEADAGKPEQNAELIAQTLGNFGIKVSVEEINIGPTVTQYALKPEGTVKLSKITELANNLELSLAAHPIRMEAPIPGKSLVGIEIPNRKAAIVRLKEIITSETWAKPRTTLGFALGRDIAGTAMVADLATMPHLLIAGATGSGKSIMINSLLMSLLYRHSPADMKLIMVDPKRVELKLYDGIPHLLAPVIVEPEKCISALKWATAEMERRYSVFAELGKRNIAEYNSANKENSMPYIVIVIDELADLMMMAPQDVESLIVRIAQKARATGIHLVIATQRPSVNVITGLIKANIPARLAFSTVSQVDSRTIIDQSGAEKLLGKGDMLFLGPDLIKPRRVQGVFVSEPEVTKVTNFLREASQPAYNEEILNQDVKLGKHKVSDSSWEDGEDALLNQAAQLVIESRKASASLIQRRLRVGYARAARLLDMLEERGIISAPDGSRPREVLVDSVSETVDESETS